jgi:hypothetical protein
MKKMIFAAAVLAAVSYAYAAKSQTERAPIKAAIGAGEEAHAPLEVVKVSKLTRTVTFKDELGETVKIRVPSDVINLDQIKPGTTFEVRYTKAAAVAIGKTGAVPAGAEEAVVAPDSGNGREMVHNRMVVGKVENVDLDRRELKIKAPDEETITLQVAPGVTGLEDVKQGDDAAIRFTEAVAVSVMPKGRGSVDQGSPHE